MCGTTLCCQKRCNQAAHECSWRCCLRSEGSGFGHLNPCENWRDNVKLVTYRPWRCKKHFGDPRAKPRLKKGVERVQRNLERPGTLERALTKSARLTGLQNRYIRSSTRPAMVIEDWLLATSLIPTLKLQVQTRDTMMKPGTAMRGNTIIRTDAMIKPYSTVRCMPQPISLLTKSRRLFPRSNAHVTA